jgi:carbonic anhydrase
MEPISKEILRSMTPAEALERLMEGNRRFTSGVQLNVPLIRQAKITADDQFPFAAILACSDSRSPAEHIFHLGIGQIFSVRIAGNIVNRDILGSLEYSCKVLGSKLILVMGHTSCGAVTAACTGVKMGNITPLLSRLQGVIDTFHEKPLEVDQVAERNVLHSILQIRQESPVLTEMEEEGEIMIRGAMYDLASGRVTLLNEEAGVIR